LYIKASMFGLLGFFIVLIIKVTASK